MSAINLNEINQRQNQSNNLFIEINKKNSFEVNYNKDYSYLEELLIKKGVKTENNYSQDFFLIYDYLNNFFPECNFDQFLTSLYISNNIMNTQNKKELKNIYKDFDFFFLNPKEIKPNSIICINKHFREIGYLLCFIYDSLNKYNIEHMNKFNEEINNIIIKPKINIYEEFVDFSKNKNNYKNDSAFKMFINKNKDKYNLPCELILLMNYFRNIYSVNIDYEKLILDERDFLLLSITLINISIIFPKMNYLKLNIINLPLQNDINIFYFQSETNALNYSNKYSKVIYSIYEQNNNKNSIIDLVNKKITINDIISKHKNILSSIIITFLCFQKFIIMNKIDLTIDENYKEQFYFLFEKYCFLDSTDSFHIINLMQMKDDFFDIKLNLNFLDYITTKKLLEFIYKNKLVYLLNLSLFSSEASYTNQTLYKLYSQHMKNDSEKNTNKNSFIKYKEEPEKYFLNKMLNYFEKNISLLFDIITTKKNLSKLILYINIPSMLITHQLYMIILIKFVFNILILLDDENNALNVLSLFCPNVILDKDKCPCLDDYLDEFDVYKKNKALLELNLNVQIYKLINIKNLVSTNLIILNIGDFDLISFSFFINYITSYKFSIKSNLKKITIGLIKSIIDFSSNVKKILSKFFSIKIFCLIELNLSSNILLERKDDYINLISYLKYNCISSSNIVLNEKSKNILDNNKEIRNGIKYLELNIKQETNSNKQKIEINKCYWIIKFLLGNKYKIEKNIINKICYGIFKYLVHEFNMKITHD